MPTTMRCESCNRVTLVRHIDADMDGQCFRCMQWKQWWAVYAAVIASMTDGMAQGMLGAGGTTDEFLDRLHALAEAVANRAFEPNGETGAEPTETE